MHLVSNQELIVIVLFVGMVLGIYGLAAFFLIRKCLPKTRSAKFGLLGNTTLILAAIATCCATYALLVEPYRLDVTHYDIPVHNLSASSGPIRVVQISDLHCDPIKRLEDKLPGVIAAQHPDVILFTGDSVNSVDGAQNFYELINKLQQIAPLFAVKGDWDFAMPIDVLTKCGVKMATMDVLNIRGAKVCIAGAESGADCAPLMAKLPADMPVVFMYHSPAADIIINKSIKGIDLFCCGHTHGGQIALPFIGPLISQSIAGAKYAVGMNKLNDAAIYTNRGIGMEGHFPRMRFCAVPEVAVFDLIPAPSR